MPTKLTYSEKLLDPRWQKKRLEIFERDAFACRHCGEKDRTLCVHHLEYSRDPWDVPDESLITLCEHCHTMVERFKKHINLQFTSYRNRKVIAIIASMLERFDPAQVEDLWKILAVLFLKRTPLPVMSAFSSFADAELNLSIGEPNKNEHQ